jgi:hypothetical protein
MAEWAKDGLVKVCDDMDRLGAEAVSEGAAITVTEDGTIVVVNDDEASSQEA